MNDAINIRSMSETERNLCQLKEDLDNFEESLLELKRESLKLSRDRFEYNNNRETCAMIFVMVWFSIFGFIFLRRLFKRDQQ